MHAPAVPHENQRAAKLSMDLFDELNNGSIILIDTAKDFLKGNSAHFGRIFISLVLQAALERLIRSRYRVESDLEGYLRRILYNLAADGWRRRAAGERRLRLIRSTPSADAAVGPAPNIDLRDALVRLLVQLPPRQRTVIVLRFWAQLSEAETAEMLGCSEGTVKSAASRGM